MKIKITIIALILCSFATNQNLKAQIVMHESGQISLQEYTDDWEKGIQIFPEGEVYFNTEQTHAWHWVTIASPKHPKGKCWIVTYPDGETDPDKQKKAHSFFVTGDGCVFQRCSFVISDAEFQEGVLPILDPGTILDGITGTYYTHIDWYSRSREGNKRVGVSAEEVEKVLPEAVARDENDQMYVDYNALTVVLIEAYKEQNAEIERLRKTLEEHGLLEPEK